MTTFQFTVRGVVCLMCLMFAAAGCGQDAESPQAPKVVRQKIAPPAAQQVQAQKAEPSIPQPVGPSAGVEQPQPPEGKAVADESEPGPPGIASARQKQDILSEAAEVNTEEKIDPFAPLFRDEPIEAGETEKEEKMQRRIPLTPLEKIDLGQLKLVAIVRARSGDRALVEESSGKGYIVTKGTYIGMHSGRIIEILGDRIIIEEEVEDILGKITISRKELKLQKPPGEI